MAQVVAALQAPRAQPTYWARWHEFFRLVPTVQAQQTGNLAGIVVVARQGSIFLDRATTDATGRFSLRVASGAVTLTFTTATFPVPTNLSIPANSAVVLVVSLQPTQVVVSTQVVVVEGDLSPLRCTEGTVRLPAQGPVQLPAEVPSDLEINGGGEDCLRAEGQCTIDLDLGGRNLTLTNCARCIQAGGNADVRLTNAGTLSCTASEDGILAQGTASVSLAATSLTIAGGEHGVHASGNAEVVLDVPTCTITGDEGRVRIDGNATIDDCPTQVVVPPDGMLSPLRCTEGTVSLPAQLPAQLPAGVPLVINGGGEDCLRAEGQCSIDLNLGDRNLTLTECERCIQAGGNADVRLTTAGTLSCTASEDGILAQGTASVSLAATSLSIAGGEHGVHASGNAEVVLDAPTCRITGDEGPERIDGNATIDSCATQVVVPPNGMLSPLRCTEGTVSLPAQLPAQLPVGVPLVINGGGEDCLRAEGQCSIALNLGGRSLTLTGCERCIQAGGNADVRLTNAGTLSCTASEDGILAQGTASVSLAATSLSIAGGEHGVHASGNAEVVLDAPTCRITGDEGRVRIDGNATIDDCGL